LILSGYDRTRQHKQELDMQLETKLSKSVQRNNPAHMEGKRFGHSPTFRLSFLAIFSLAILPLMAASAWCAAQAPAQAVNQTPAEQTMLAIFTDPNAPRISHGLWKALVTALEQELAFGSPETRALVSQTMSQTASTDVTTQIHIVRGDQIPAGLVVDNSISVYLHGDCAASPIPSANLFGHAHPPDALGWVLINNGSIEHFIHVECTHIGQVLGLRAIHVNSYQRDQLMAVAIARVILHEWIHISTQSPHHARSGITKAQFSIADLVAHASKPKQISQEKRGPQASAADRADGIGCSKLPALDSPAQPCLRGTK
jgi:hypothetical protein